MQCVVFDFDGTLRKGHVTQLFKDALYTNGCFSAEEYRIQNNIFDQYNSNEINYTEWLDKWVISWGRAFKGLEVEKVMNIAVSVFDKAREDIYPEAFELVDYFNKKKIKTILLSAGASEVIGLIAKHLNFDHYIATQQGVSDKKYTGKVISTVHTSIGKGQTLTSFLKEHNLSIPFFAFGDSLGDLSILELAKNPIALNADSELKKIAKDRSWTVVDTKNALELVKDLM
ncbi:MAG: HAD family phosphatase [Pseudomonadota bacterium]